MPEYSSNWASSNCTSIAYFIPDNKEYQGCTYYSNTGNYACNYSNGYYYGQLKNGDFHGNGKMTWKDGQSYEGTWKDGKRWCGVESKGNTFWEYKNGTPYQGEAGVDWGTVGALALIAGAAYALSEYEGGDGYSPSTSSRPSRCTFTHNYKEYTIKNPNYGDCPVFHYYEEPLMCYLASSNSKPRCNRGKACGDTCIEIGDTCHVGRGSACNENRRSYP
jgi:hypothetical protein